MDFSRGPPRSSRSDFLNRLNIISKSYNTSVIDGKTSYWANTRRRTLSRPGARCRDCSWSVSPSLSPSPPCASRRNGFSTVSAGLGPVKFGLHLRYPHPGPLRGLIENTTVQRRIFRHRSLRPSSNPLPPFAMRPAFPISDYYGGSAPPDPFSYRCAYPGKQAERPPPGTATR